MADDRRARTIRKWVLRAFVVAILGALVLGRFDVALGILIVGAALLLPTLFLFLP
jgi:hypothetical protein